MKQKCSCNTETCLSCYSLSLMKKHISQQRKLNYLNSEKEIRHSLYAELKLSILINNRIKTNKTNIELLDWNIDLMAPEAACNEEKFLMRKELIERRDGLYDEINGAHNQNCGRLLSELKSRKTFAEIESEIFFLINERPEMKKYSWKKH